MRARSLLRTLVLAVLAVSTCAGSVASPLHEAQALRGHEHCGAPSKGPVIHHVCHDEDACTVCGLLALPSVSDGAPQTSDLPAAAPQASASAPVAAVVADRAEFAAARAPPAA